MPSHYVLDIELKGETPEQLWCSLLDLMTYACQCRLAQDGLWPHMIRTDHGKIVVNASDKKTHLQ